MNIGSYIDGRTLAYDEGLFQFTIGGTPVKLSDLRAWDNAGQISWNDESQHQWMLALDQGDFEAAALAATGTSTASDSSVAAASATGLDAATQNVPEDALKTDTQLSSSTPTQAVEPAYGAPQPVQSPYGAAQPAQSPQAQQPYAQQPYAQQPYAPAQGGQIPPVQNGYGYGQAPAPAPKKSKTWIIVLVIILVVLLLGCCGGSIWFGSWVMNEAESSSNISSGSSSGVYTGSSSSSSSLPVEEDLNFSPTVIADDSNVTITLKEKWNCFGFLDYTAEITNKTDMKLLVVGDDDFRVDGQSCEISFDPDTEAAIAPSGNQTDDVAVENGRAFFVQPGETLEFDIDFFAADGAEKYPTVTGTVYIEDRTGSAGTLSTLPLGW